MFRLGRTCLASLAQWCAPFRRPRTGLRQNVSASLPVLEVLEKQIRESVSKGDSETDKLCQRFSDLIELSSQAVQLAVDSRSGSDAVETDEIKQVISSLMEQVRSNNACVHRTAEMLSRIESELDEMTECMKRIDEVAKQSRMVSLNGQIEAARAGVHGQGFDVVAKETGQLATNISETSQAIRSIADTLNQTIRGTIATAKEKAESGSEKVSQCERSVQNLLQHLEVYHAHLEQDLDQAQSRSEQFSKVVSEAMISLQFQDAVSQRLHHVVDSMEAIRTSFSDHVAAPSGGAEKQLSDEWLNRIYSSYTVAAERQIHGQNDFGTASGESQEGSVELF